MVTITESLRDYLESLSYEVNARDFLLKWAERKRFDQSEAYNIWKQERCEYQIMYCTAVKTVDEMYPGGWKFPKGKDYELYTDMIRRLFPLDHPEEMHMGGPHVKSITIQVTEDCNMKCTYCYQVHKTANKMSTDTAERFIDYILGDTEIGNDPYINPSESEGVVLDFIGGEPFLEVDLMQHIADYFIEKVFFLHHRWATRFMFSISSNGLLYFDPRVQKFLDDFGPRVSLGISIDGNKKLHDSCRVDKAGNGTYDRAIQAVHHYTDVRNGKIGSKMTIAPGNVKFVCNAVLCMLEQGYTNINLNCVFEEGWTIEHARTLYQQLCMLADYLVKLPVQPIISIFNETIGHPLNPLENQNWCGGNGLMLAVDYRGDLYPCVRYMESSLGGKAEPYVIGNIKDGVCRKDRLECLRCITRRSQSTDACFNCPIASGCAWCTAYNYQIFGTPNRRATFICVMHRARVLANEYYWKLLGKEYAVNMPKEWREEIVNAC